MLIDAPDAIGPDAVIVPLGEAAMAAATSIVADLRRSGVACDMAYKGNMKKRMAKANNAGARFAIIIGDDELAKGKAAVKNLASGEQADVAFDALAGAVQE